MKEWVILCVDDEDIVLRSLQRELNHTLGKKYIIETATDAEDALELFQELQQNGHDMPVVIADHIMPGMKGAELLARIHALSPRTMTIMLTGQADMKDVIRAVNSANLYRYIAKPWERADLALTVKEAVRRYVQEHKLLRQNAILKNVKHTLEQKVKERTAELEAQHWELQRSNASKDKFFSILARDLRNPFAGLLDLTNSIVQHISAFSPDEIKQHVETLRDSAGAVHTLIENLLTWAQLQQGLLPYQPTTLSVRDLVDEIKLSLASNLTHKRLIVRNQVEKDVAAYGDKPMLALALHNLITNAMKYSYPGGSITVSGQMNEHRAIVTIADRGTGIDGADLPKLFRLDTRFSTPGTNGETGAGLGLILCQALVEHHQGDVRLESEVGRGTTVTVAMPATATP
jgi:two-component system, sensor histidine kinase and response regulator